MLRKWLFQLGIVPSFTTDHLILVYQNNDDAPLSQLLELKPQDTWQDLGRMTDDTNTERFFRCVRVPDVATPGCEFRDTQPGDTYVICANKPGLVEAFWTQKKSVRCLVVTNDLSVRAEADAFGYSSVLFSELKEKQDFFKCILKTPFQNVTFDFYRELLPPSDAFSFYRQIRDGLLAVPCFLTVHIPIVASYYGFLSTEISQMQDLQETVAAFEKKNNRALATLSGHRLFQRSQKLKREAFVSEHYISQTRTMMRQWWRASELLGPVEFDKIIHDLEKRYPRNSRRLG